MRAHATHTADEFMKMICFFTSAITDTRRCRAESNKSRSKIS